jgi:hypothetical protein
VYFPPSPRVLFKLNIRKSLCVLPVIVMYTFLYSLYVVYISMVSCSNTFTLMGCTLLLVISEHFGPLTCTS